MNTNNMNTNNMNAKQLKKWAADAKENSRFVYHRGINATRDGIDKAESCAAAWDLYTRGEVALFQRRKAGAEGVFEYIAVRLRSPKTKRFWLTCEQKDALSQTQARTYVRS